MSRSTLEHAVFPPDESLDGLVALLDAPEALSTTLIGPTGEQISMPPEVFEVLRDVVAAMAQG